jgi:hypothetical protein
MAEGDAGFAEVVGRHFDVDFVTDTDADEVLAHLAGDVGEDFVTVGQSDAKHGARQHLGNDTGQFNGFFFSQALLNYANGYGTEQCAFSGLKSRHFWRIFASFWAP